MNKPIDVDTIWKSGATEALDVAVQLKPFRSWLMGRAERHLEQKFFEENRDRMPLRVQRMRKRALMNLLYSIDRGIRRRIISPHVRKRVLSTFVGNVLTGEKDRMKPFREQHGVDPPTFVTISPTKRCNLQCTGCYAGSTSSEKSTLGYETFTRIIHEKREEWGSHFTVISGGEPLMYRSQGKTLLDVISEHPDNYFMMYTNGTLITDEAAQRMAELGNIVPAISVEGWEQETDERRGRGVFRKIETAMENLRRHGVPFGISVTATRHNAETVLSDEFMDYFFDEHGAIFGWIFQYMPIGRSYTVDLMVTPVQRRWMLEREMDLVYKQDRFMIDFWNGGPMSLGCIAAGRSGGYFYIDWNGNIAPCVFFPYAVANINEIYEQGGSISDVLWSGLFTRMRDWQTDQRGNYGQGEVKNLFCPCPIRDHHQFAERLITDHDVRPLDPDAEAAYGDAEYHRRMREYDERLREHLDPLWETEFETAAEEEKERAGTM